MEAFFQFIERIGFPIACCGFLIYNNVQNEKAQKALLEKMRESIDMMKDAIQELTFYIKEDK
jgi:predicted transcriptional regulator